MSGKRLTFLTISVAAMVTLLAAAMFGQTIQKDSIFRHLSVFTEVFSLVRSSYVDEVPPAQLVDGAFAGITDAIDEYSYYISPGQMAEYRAFTSHTTNDTGIIASRRYGFAYVVAVTEGSPAEAAGMKPGDVIDSISGEATQKMALWQVESALRGRSNRPVTISLLRSGMSKRETITVNPKAFAPAEPRVEYMGDVAYVDVPSFAPGMSAKFSAAIASVQRKGANKLIIDVRNNADGSIAEAIASADQLLESGLITSLVGRRIEKKSWTADDASAYKGDVLVLIDSSTASSGEVFASAIHGNKRGRLVGLPTFGRSIEQKYVPLSSGGALYVTVGHYTTPQEKSILAMGIRPDVTVDMSRIAIEGAEEAARDKEDVILERALKLYGEAPAKAAA
jgi:carboxyl-terminal processing protease